MTPERRSYIEKSIIRYIGGFGVDHSLSHQSMGLIGLAEMNRNISRTEFVEVLKGMKGVVLDTSGDIYMVRVPTKYFSEI